MKMNNDHDKFEAALRALELCTPELGLLVIQEWLSGLPNPTAARKVLAREGEAWVNAVECRCGVVRDADDPSDDGCGCRR